MGRRTTATMSPVVETLEGRELYAADAGAVPVASFAGPLPAAAYTALLKAEGRSDEQAPVHASLSSDPVVPDPPVPQPVRYWSSTGGNTGTGGWLRTEYRNLPK